MSTERPTVAPQLVAALIESTPERVRRRLDRTPDVAATWDWQAGDATWSVHTDGEHVTLPHGHVVSVEQLTCTCLLSPRCFHVLACLTRLEVAIVDSGIAAEACEPEPVSPDSQADVVEPDAKQRHAVAELGNTVAHLLRVGFANAGVVVQSGMLRAIHQCRAEGLHRLAALGLRVIAGTGEFRARSPAADPAQLAEDVADLLETSRHVQSGKAIAGFWIGTARRKQLPVRPRRLHGLLAEPLITRSGFAGAAVYFLGEDDRIYTAADVRPGDAQHARDAYLGGIEIGPLVQPARQLARGLYLGSDLTASQDGRLGRGKGIQMVDQGSSTWQAEAIQQRFRRPLADQCGAVYAQASLPADVRAAGWDLVFFAGAVVGAVGAELLFHLTTKDQLIHLAIENENAALQFRENLRMLSHAPGLRLQVIARVNLLDPAVVHPLAIAPLDDEQTVADAPRLEIPRSLGGRVCLGFDEIQSHHIVNARASMVLHAQKEQSDQGDPLGSLRRRWIATMLSGTLTQRQSNRSAVGSEMAVLNRSGFATAAALLDALCSSHADGGPASIDCFLATAVYLRSCRLELARSRAVQFESA